MFIYTLKASSIKFFAVVLLSVVVLVTLIAVIPEYGSAGDVAVVSIQYGEVKTNDDRLAFIRQFGYTASRRRARRSSSPKNSTRCMKSTTSCSARRA